MNVSFYVKPPEKQNGLYQSHRLTAARPVYMYVLSEYKSQRAVHPTGLKVKHDQTVSDKGELVTDDKNSHWDEDLQRVKKRAPGAISINRELDRLQRIAESVVDELRKAKQMAADEAGEAQRAPVTKDDIKNALNEKTKRKQPQRAQDHVKLSQCIADRAKVLIEDSQHRGTQGWRVYQNLHRHFEAFCRQEYTPEWEDMRIQFFEDFRDFLRQQPAQKNRYADSDKTLSDSYIGKLISTLFTFLRYARKRGYINHSHFEGIRLKEDLRLQRRKLVEGVYLTIQEVRELSEADLSELEPMAQTVRDCFVSACLHGQRHSDWHKVSRTGRTEKAGGIEFVEVITKKGQGEKIALAPIFALTASVLDNKGGNMPNIPLGTVNRLIKAIGEAAGLDRTVNDNGELVPLFTRLTSHVARRSFVSNMREVGTPDHVLSLVTTHGKRTMTDNYDRRENMRKARALVPYLRKMENGLQGGQAVIREVKTA
jgi:hypothetical protein